MTDDFWSHVTTPRDGYIGDGDLEVTHLSDAQHRCDTIYDKCPTHRRVFGDLVPIEQYSNGGDGRHQMTEIEFAEGLLALMAGIHPTTTETE